MSDIEPMCIGERIELKTDEEETYYSKVQDILSDNHFVITVPAFQGRDWAAFIGNKGEIRYYRTDAQYRFVAEVKRRYKQRQLRLLEMQIVSPIERIQRRKFFRLQIIRPVKFRVLEAQEEFYEGFTIDVSAGGLSLRTTYPVPLDSIVECLLPGKDDEEINVKGRVIRVESESEPETPYEIAVDYEDMPERIRKQIIQFIYHEQRRLLKRDLR